MSLEVEKTATAGTAITAATLGEQVSLKVKEGATLTALTNKFKYDFFFIILNSYFELRYAIKTCWASTTQQIRDTVDGTGAAGTDGTDDDDGKY